VDQELSGQVALVTGSGRGIGRAIAQAVAGAGASVVVTARSADEVRETVALIERGGGTALGQTADVTDSASVSGLVDAAIARFGQIDLLVNNAGVGGPFGPLSDVDIDEGRLSAQRLSCPECSLVARGGLSTSPVPRDSAAGRT
jgi:NAD(P)-dependent dehydrogenase (short-subunit alcohol dehydrogenase family)